jgi:hypothetical protein
MKNREGKPFQISKKVPHSALVYSQVKYWAENPGFNAAGYFDFRFDCGNRRLVLHLSSAGQALVLPPLFQLITSLQE